VEQTDYVFFTKFIRMAGSNPASVLLRTPSEFIKGRQAARFNVTIPFSYFLNHREFKDGVVHNLSLDGLLATIPSNPDLKVKDRVACKLFIPNSPFPLLISGLITRINLKPDKKYQIAMHFPYIANDIQDKIVKFLFSAQKKMAFKAPELRMNFPNQSASTIRKIG
jgi:c-di-GMP-binding flagellar brake protein YcgR